jgi:hypothetical protein
MSILIKGMEMPKTHPLTVTIYPDGQVLSETVGARDVHGTAVYVPPHGRLIDADKLAEEQKENVRAYHANLITLDDLAECLLKQSISEDGAPTIIPAEEG